MTYGKADMADKLTEMASAYRSGGPTLRETLTTVLDLLEDAAAFEREMAGSLQRAGNTHTLLSLRAGRIEGIASATSKLLFDLQARQA